MDVTRLGIFAVLIFTSLLLLGCGQPASKCGDGVCGPLEKADPKLCPKDCKGTVTPTSKPFGSPTVIPSSSITPSSSINPSSSSTPSPSNSDYTIDADGFLWGTETDSILREEADSQLYADVINDNLRTKAVKIRIAEPMVLYENGEFQPYLVGCPPSVPASSCTTRYSLDALAKIFEDNNWRMMPMLTHNYVGNSIDDEKILKYVDFTDWFVGRYKDSANIDYVELVNAPFDWWKGTPSQLLDASSRVYDRLKSKYPDVKVGTPGFEYFSDDSDASKGAERRRKMVEQIEYFLDNGNGAQFDFWAFHGYSTVVGVNGKVTPYPPTKTAINNKYAGIQGIVEIRKKLNDNGWEDRPIFETEQVGLWNKIQITADEDKLDAAYLVQDLLLKKTLRFDGKPVLMGISSMKINKRGGSGEGKEGWGSLSSDGSIPVAFNAVSLLISKMKIYNYASHISGEFDNSEIPWVEKFTSGNKELYVFFKPFEYNANSGGVVFDSKTSNYALDLKEMPSSIRITKLDGTVASISASDSLILEAENSPQLLEIEYRE